MKKPFNIVFIAAVAALTIIGTGCGQSYAGDSYSRGEARTGQNVRYATIMEIAWVELDADDSTRMLGAVGGGVIGGLLGNTVGGGSGKRLATGVGAVGGAVAGSAIAGSVSTKRALEIMVRYENGKEEVIVQEPGRDSFFVGQEVRVVGNGSTARVRP